MQTNSWNFFVSLQQDEEAADKFYLLSVEICLDPNLSVVDCKSKKNLKTQSHKNYMYLTENQVECPPHSPITYTDYFSQTNRNEEL